MSTETADSQELNFEKLQRNISDLKLLHHAITKSYHNEAQLFSQYLEVGSKILELETGIISQISGDNYTIKSVSSPIQDLEIGLVFNLDETYCAEVISSKRTVSYPHVGSVKKMQSHPVYVNLQLESYISAPVFVEGRVYGTINFTDRSVRKENFNSHQLEIIEIMAMTIGRFLEAQIQKQKVKQLVNIIAHDIKTPIGNVMSLSELILSETTENSTKEYTQIIQEVSSNCYEMVNCILDIGSIEDGRTKLSRTIEEISLLVTDAWNMTKCFFDKKGLSLELGENNLSFPLDKVRMQQALMNLFTNAAKFSQRGSAIRVSWKIENDELCINVSDSGIGIPQEKIVHLFDQSKATSSPGTEGETGTGYGLPLVSKIVTIHNGRIEVFSKVGKGTTFTINIPKS